MGWAGALAPMLLASGARVVLASDVSLSRRCCCGAPLRPLPSLRSPCRHVVVAPMRSRCHCALADDRRPYALRAVLRCLSGMSVAPALSAELSLLSWGVVAVHTRLIVARASLAANGRLRAPRPECGMGSISHVSSRWSKQCQYSDSLPPPAHIASSHPSGAR